MTTNNESGALVAAYIDARAAFLDAEKAADAVQVRLARAAAAVGTSRPGHGQAPRSFNEANPNDWLRDMPEREEVRAAMVAWFGARMAVREAHKALPPEIRAHIQPLPQGAGPE